MADEQEIKLQGVLPSRYRNEKEGQFLERKSCFNRKPKTPKPLPLKKISAEIAETLVALANADGGELIVGLDDDGKTSGLPYTERQLSNLVNAPASRIVPALEARSWVYDEAGRQIVVFEVGSSSVAHRTTSGKYLYRDHDKNQPMDAERIAHLKALKRQTLTEHAIIPDASLADFREDLIRRVSDKIEPGLSPRDALIRLRLAEPSNGHLRGTFAALLLFAKDPEKWHPKAHVEYLRFRGVSREHGAKLNVIGRQSIVSPLVELPEKIVAAVAPHIGQRQALYDLFFTERAEYPKDAWEEAIVNAVAHRDYGLRGTPIEIHHYDDRIEVMSPGTPVPPMNITALRGGGGGHASRNPLIVRVLTLTGLMREIGEGIPRMFFEMAENGLHAPEFNERPHGCLTVTLRNAPIWDEKTRAWLARFKDKQLSPNQLRLLVLARQQDARFTSAHYQKMAGIDIYTASQDIKDLIRKGIVRLERKGGRVYMLSVEPQSSEPEDFQSLAALLAKKKSLSNQDLRQIWGADRQAALRRAKRLVEEGWLIAEGQRRGRRYVRGPKAG